jgi:serine/threonine-protein kinase HipA
MSSVYLHGKPTGRLWADASGINRFEYFPQWIAEGVPLSRQLPLQEAAFFGTPVASFFSGLLPEAETRARVASILGISEANDVAMLDQIGGECAGAITVLPDGEKPAMQNDNVRWLEASELAKVLKELPRRPLLAGEEGVRFSLAGAQSKLPVVMTQTGAIGLPLGSAPSTHILKPEPLRFPGLAANEYLCMTLARRIGLETPEVELRTLGEVPCLIVQRYDRKMTHANTVERVHQEDFCQALGVMPERKYQTEGGPGVRECVSLLREWSSVPVADIGRFIDGVIYATIIGNADAHGKNWSFLYPPGKRRLAPLYDLVCTLAWPEFSTRMAMKIGSAWTLPEVAPAHFRKMAESVRLGWPSMRARIYELSACVADDVAHIEVPAAREGVDRLRKIIHERAGRMADLVEG